MIKTLFSFALLMYLTSCGTIGGAISGVGEDIKDVGDFIKSE
ncbi:hypothetical protein N9V03_00645 [Alphaproteobacteria bacterium]|jgi:predicted small secreted protein|nr:hypothetical protein [Alphaproteobacteria bacterium]|tara:strand:- start:248 stop:373 length:126 start_codon:yes stop_codon:yes gene_type:complete